MYAIIKKEKTYIKAGFLIFIFSIIIFVIAVPGYTYKQAEQSVVDSYKVREVKLLSLDHQTVPIETSSWFQHDKMYYVAVEADKVDYYAVDPNQGDPIRLEGPYWQHSE